MQSLPEDILLYIFSFNDGLSLLNILRTCKAFQQLLHSNMSDTVLWKNLITSLFPHLHGITTPNIVWRKLFKAATSPILFIAGRNDYATKSFEMIKEFKFKNLHFFHTGAEDPKETLQLLDKYAVVVLVGDSDTLSNSSLCEEFGDAIYDYLKQGRGSFITCSYAQCSNVGAGHPTGKFIKNGMYTLPVSSQTRLRYKSEESILTIKVDPTHFIVNTINPVLTTLNDDHSAGKLPEDVQVILEMDTLDKDPLVTIRHVSTNKGLKKKKVIGLNLFPGYYKPNVSSIDALIANCILWAAYDEEDGQQQQQQHQPSK